MIPKECKRLAEVDFPIAVVSKHSAREKPIVHRHPQSFHQWWARRPLAACRAMLLALLWPDPCDPNCPEEFKEKARKVLAPLPGKVGKTDDDLRRALLKFIGDFADWDRSSDAVYLEASRTLVKAAHTDEPPLVVDPFAGGGSIPLEAVRVGCDAFASDLNPVACLILKVMLENIPRYGRKKITIKKPNGEQIETEGLGEALLIIGKDIQDEAERELTRFYPDDEDGARPMAYLWARAVKCEAPKCGAEIPLIRSFWLSKKANKKIALRYKVIRNDGAIPEVEFEIFEPKNDKDVPEGTVTRAKATCLACGKVLPAERVQTQLTSQRGGADTIFDKNGNRTGGALLLAVVTIKPTERGRNYRIATHRDYQAVLESQLQLGRIVSAWQLGERVFPCPVPDEPTPSKATHRAVGSQLPLYGFNMWRDIFTARQSLFLSVLADKISNLSEAFSLNEVAALIVSRLADRLASLLGWDAGGEKLGHVFNRQALPMVWDFAEGAPLANASGSYANVMHQIQGAVQSVRDFPERAQVQLLTASNSVLPDEVASVWFTDPPYYDAVPYADLSDFFFV